MNQNRNTAGPRLLAFFTALAILLSLSSCGLTTSIDDVINRMESAQLTIEQQGAAWRSELDKLTTDLDQMEGKVADDVRTTVTSTTNQVHALATDAVAMTDQAIESRIAQAGAEFRCNGNFVKQSVSDELGFLIDDLKFWKEHRKLGAQPPTHGTCWIDPSTTSMYQSSEGNWVADTANMEANQPIINIYGYNFRSDALPKVDLQTTDDGTVTTSPVKATYRTNYLISIDLSAGLANMSTNLKLVLNWPDDPKHGDSSTISLLRTSEAKLVLSEALFSPAHPVATKDPPVILKIKVTNVGGRKGGVFDVGWTPEPGAMKETVAGHPPLAPGASDSVAFPAHQFQNSGDIYSNVTISSGVSENYLVTVAPPPHIPAGERNYGTADNDPKNDFPKQDQRVVRWGDLGGLAEQQNYGGPCAAGYVRSQMSLSLDKHTQYNGKELGSATISWANDNPHDCTVLVHYQISTPGLGQPNNVIVVTIFITEKGV